MKKETAPGAPGNEQTITDTRTAKIRITKNGARAKGFTFARDAIVTGVPMVHAEYLKDSSEAEVLEVQ